MGASHSAGQRSRHSQRFAPEFAASNPNSNSSGHASNKNSFGRQQLNRLFRKSLPIQSRHSKGNAGRPNEISRPERSAQYAARGGNNRAGRVLDDSQFHDHDHYYVPPDYGERLVGASEPGRQNNGQPRESSPADRLTDRATEANRPLGQSHQRSLVRQRQQQQQQQQQQTPRAIEQHTNKSNSVIMTTNSNKMPQSGQQPLNSSSARHQNHHSLHQARHQQQQQQQQVQNQNQLQHQQQAAANCTARPNKMSGGKAQQKSSCSPSSASAASSPTSSSSSAAGFSSSESLKLRQRQLNAPLPAELMSGDYEGRRARDRRHQHQQQQQLVAMQLNHEQPLHRRAHSGGQPLSWSKQQQQQQQQNQQAASMISNDMLAMVQRQNQSQSTAQVGRVEQTSRGQQQVPTREHRAHLHQMVSPDRYHQTQQSRSLSKFNQTAFDHADDPYHSNSVHLVAVNQFGHEANTSQQPFQSYAAGHLSRPVQRRDLWPSQQLLQQQQHHFSDTSGASYAALSDYQPQFYVSAAPSRQPALNQSAIYDELEFMQASSQPASYFNQEPAGHYIDCQTPQIQSGSLKSRSKSLGRKSSSTSLSNKSRSRNPLAGIFSPADAKKQTARFGANTIHNFNKWNQDWSNSSSTIARSAGASANSLKRLKSSPLAASSYEAMRAIDMYLIRQIARSCMDFETEQKIDLEIRLRELATQSLLEAQTEVDLLEVEKSLLTSDQRMNCYASQLEQKRKRLSNRSLSTNDSGRGSKTSHWDSSRATAKATKPEAGPTDVIGANGVGSLASARLRGLDSPSSSYSRGSHQLSPVSNESTNSKRSPPPALSKTNTASSSASSSNETDGGSKQQHSWSSLSRSKHHVIRRPTSAADTLNRRRKSQRQQHIEQLAQMLAKLYNLDYTPSPETRSTISLSELRVPLMWRDVDHFKGRGEYRRFAVFCVAKIGSQIYDTQLVSDVDRHMTDLTFDDVILFNNVELDFELELEVYSCIYLEQFSLSNTPRKLMEKFSNSVGRAMGRRLATRTASVNYIKELEAYDKSYRFAMIASTKLTLADASDSIKTYDLRLISPEAHGRHFTGHSYHQASIGVARNQPSASAFTPNGNGTQAMSNREHQFTGGHNGSMTTGNHRDLVKNTLPLFGHFCCRLHVRPDTLDDTKLNTSVASTTFGYL